jgi:hypothetical protein
MSNDIKSTEDHPVPRRKTYLNIFLLLPFIALLWLPFYNDVKPAFLGFPFFYWYQLLWVPITSLIIFVVYKGNR